MKTLNENILYELLQEQLNQNKTLTNTINELHEQIKSLHTQLSRLQHLLFGQKSEKQSKKEKAATPSKLGLPKEDGATSNKNGRRTLPDILEREIIRHEIPEEERQCPQCPGKLHCIGKEVTEQLDYVPAKLKAIEHIRYKYGCKCCKRYMVTAPMTEHPIDKGLASAGLLAEVLINKYEDALPLYRCQQQSKSDPLFIKSAIEK